MTMRVEARFSTHWSARFNVSGSSGEALVVDDHTRFLQQSSRDIKSAALAVRQLPPVSPTICISPAGMRASKSANPQFRTDFLRFLEITF